MTKDTTYTDIYTALNLMLTSPTLSITSAAVTQTVTVRAQFNDQQAVKPVVVIPSATKDEIFNKFSSEQGKKFINVPIEVYASNTLFRDLIIEEIEDRLKKRDWGNYSLIRVNTIPSFVNPQQVKYHAATMSIDFQKE